MSQEPFLQSLARQMHARFGERLCDVHVVLPSRRACLYFKRYLAETAQTPMLAPQVLAMEDFVASLSEVEMADPVSLLLELYEIYRRHDRQADHTLDKFAPLGTAILRDFGAIDRNIDEEQAQNLFAELEAAKAIERWAEQLGEEIDPKNSRLLDEYFAFWSHLRHTYADFRQHLAQKHQAYSGLAFRLVLNDIQRIAEAKLYHVVFAGFNVLTRVEAEIIQSLVRLHKADTWWDIDAHYMREGHEAGEYLRRYQTAGWVPKTGLPQRLNHPDRVVEIVQVSSIIAQAKFAGQYIRQVLHNAGDLSAFVRQPNKLAILLPNENLLLPLLHALPEYLHGQPFQTARLLNITMGLPFTHTPVFDLVEQIFRMQENMRQQPPQVYFRDIVRILRHPYLHLMPDHSEWLRKKDEDIHVRNQVYIPIDELLSGVPEESLLYMLCQPWEGQSSRIFSYFKEAIERLANAVETTNQIAYECLYQLYGIIQRLEDVTSRTQEAMSIRTVRQLLLETLRAKTIPFSGEPVSPIQVMGMLESRALDFEEVLILSVTEGDLPKSKIVDSIIPLDLCRQYGLPTHQEHDASYAYTFYRLLHCARKVTLVYSDGGSGIGHSEPSRFVAQLASELDQVRIVRRRLLQSLPASPDPNPRVHKDAAVMDKIREQLAKGVSPSSISMYISDPLSFFYEKILRLSDETAVEEHLAANTFGTVVHRAIELMFESFVGKWVTNDDIDQMAVPAHIEARLHQAVEERAAGRDMYQGKNFLQMEVAKDILSTFLQHQKSPNGFFLIGQEQDLRHTMQIPMADGSVLPFTLAGQADRLDLFEGKLRVVDYKTGSVSEAGLRADGRHDLFRVKANRDESITAEKGKIIQLLVYQYLFAQKLKQADHRLPLPPAQEWQHANFEAGIIYLRSTKAHNQLNTFKIDETVPVGEAFERYVEELMTVFVRDLLDEGKDFSSEPSDFQPHISLLGVPEDAEKKQTA